MKSTRFLFAAGLAIGLIAAGCGDDDDGDGDGGGEPLTKQEFVAQANQICAEGDKKIDQQGKEIFGQGKPSTAQQEQFATEVLAPEVQSQVDQIRELTPPEADEETINKILDKAEEGIAQIKADPSVIASDQGVPPALNEAGKEIGEYGAKECAN
jgi:peptide subunit release factor 1 (eRF1)